MHKHDVAPAFLAPRQSCSCLRSGKMRRHAAVRPGIRSAVRPAVRSAARSVARLVLVLALMAVGGRQASAQTLRSLTSDLFVFGSCGAPLCLGHDFAETGSALTEHGRHFLAELVPQNQALLLFFEQGITNVAGSLPATSMSGGQLWTSRSRPASMGPVFGERAETLGMGRFFIGVEATGFRVSSFNGTPASDLVLNFFHENSDVALGPDPGLGQPVFERDMLRVRTNLVMDYIVATAAVSAGVTSFMDIGVAVPVVRARLKATANAQIVSADPSFPHRFGGSETAPVVDATNSVAGSATGVGDVSARMKISLSGGMPRNGVPSGVAVALIGDVTFPTGDKEDLLGTGRGRGRASLALSGQWDRFSPHVNAGYLLRQGALEGDAITTVAGFDVRATPGVTVAMAVLAQWELDNPAYPMPGPVTFTGPGGYTVEPSSIPRQRRYAADIAAGLKFRVGSDMILVTNAVVPVLEVGLRPDVIWTFGLQGTFR